MNGSKEYSCRELAGYNLLKMTIVYVVETIVYTYVERMTLYN